MNKKNTIISYGFLALLLLVEGSALMVVELLGAKLLAPFYGSSLYVWTAVLSITVLGLSLGYFLGGKLSTQKKYIEKYLIAIFALASLLVYIMPSTANWAIQFTKNFSLIPGICISSVLLLVLPMMLFGIVGPLTVVLFSQLNTSSNSTAGLVYFISTLGGILSTFIFGYYLIPEQGLRFSAHCTSLFLLVSFFLCCINLLFFKPNYSISENSSSTSNFSNAERSYSSPPPTFLYWFAALEGATVMSVELIAARMLAPFYGASLHVWVTVIGITLLSLAIGYFFGGRLAIRKPQVQTLYWVLLAAAVFLVLMHTTAQQLTLAFMDFDLQTGVVIVALFLIVPPLLCLGMVPTLLIGLINNNSDHTGVATGKIFAISSLSGIIILPVIGFWVIPAFGLSNPSITIALIVGIIPFIKLLGQKKYRALVFLLCAVLSLSARNITAKENDVTVQYFAEGLLGQLLVADVNKAENGQQRNDRLLFVNRMGQTNVNNQTQLTNWNYMIFGTSLVSELPENSKVLLLGLGGGSLANMFQNNLKMNVDAVELDERMVNVAQDYFSLNPSVNIYIDDARHYLETTSQKYDCIFFDVFKGDVMPAHVLTFECFRKAKSLLNKNGMIIVNFNGFLSGNTGMAGRSVYKTLTTVGLQTKILPTPGEEDERNTLFVSSKENIDFKNLRSPLLHEGKSVDVNTLFLSVEKIDTINATVFYDDQLKLDKLNMKAGDIWRKGYNKVFARLFYQNGIPNFK